MRLDDFDFELPDALIAQHPLPQRSSSRLLALSCASGAAAHLKFRDLPKLLLPHDLLVFNNTRVIKARLLGRKASGGKMEIFVERIINDRQVLALLKSSKKIKIGTEIFLLNPNMEKGKKENEPAFISSSLLSPPLLSPSKSSPPYPSPFASASASASASAPRVAADVSLQPLAKVKIVAQRGDFFVVEFGVFATTISTSVAALPTSATVLDILEIYGLVPLPPYIERELTAEDAARYQSIFAERDGAVAAPTASLHFDEELMQQIKARGVDIAFVTLHVGAGTFQPVRVANVEQHHMHAEYMEVTEEVCAQIKAARARGGRVIAVGTTCVRCLETAAGGGECRSAHNHNENGNDGCSNVGNIDSNKIEEVEIKPFVGETNIFIYPGYKFRCVDALITNFHLPKSTLLMLVCAFAGYSNVMEAYKEAVKLQYRFFSYGDAMFIARRVSC